MTLVRWRVATLVIVFFSMMINLSRSLVDHQVLQVTRSRELVGEYTVAHRRGASRRGRIYDSFGRLLVFNQPQMDLLAKPYRLARDPATLSHISRRLGMDPGKVLARLNDPNLPPGSPVVLRPNLKGPMLLKASILADEFEGLELVGRFRRGYSFGKVGAHLLGYISEVSVEELRTRRREGLRWGDLVGEAGLERTYDRQLRGSKRRSQERVDVLGGVRAERLLQPASPGLDLQLTLDMELQRFAELLLAQKLKTLHKENQAASAGAAVVMEAITGKVLVLASLPEYDQRVFSRGITNAEYSRLLAHPGRPLIHRAISGNYAAGSTFKVVTASAALQEQICHRQSSFWCPGYYLTSNCFITSGHGGIGFIGSLSQSCDVVYYRLGHRLGIQRLHRYGRMFGLGELTGIDLPGESSGLLPNEVWKREVLADDWWGGDTINLSIGQGYLLVTPLQMAVVTAAIANGGTRVRPYLLGRTLTSDGKVRYHHRPTTRSELSISPEHLTAVREGMRQAVLVGTSTAAYSAMVSVAGKTGTVENSPSDDNPSGKNHTWFIAFAPVQDPEIVVVVLLERSGGFGGGQCAPLARQILERYFNTRPPLLETR